MITTTLNYSLNGVIYFGTEIPCTKSCHDKIVSCIANELRSALTDSFSVFEFKLDDRSRSSTTNIVKRNGNEVTIDQFNNVSLTLSITITDYVDVTAELRQLVHQIDTICRVNSVIIDGSKSIGTIVNNDNTNAAVIYNNTVNVYGTPIVVDKIVVNDDSVD